MRFLLLAGSWFLGAFFFSQEARDAELWFAIIGSFYLGLPIFFAQLYRATVRKIERLQSFRGTGWLYSVLQGRIVSVLVWSVIAPFLGFIQLYWLSALSRDEWFAVAAIIVVYELIRRWLLLRVESQIKRYAAAVYVGKFTHIVASLVGVVFLVGLALLTRYGNSPVDLQFEEYQGALVLSGDVSHLVQITTKLSWDFQYLQDFLFRAVSRTEELAATVIVVVATLISLLSLPASLFSFSLEKSEWRRMFAVLSEDDEPKSLDTVQAFWIGFALLILPFFVVIPMFGAVENLLRDNSAIVIHVFSYEDQVFQRLEQIGDEYYEQGTLAAVEDLQAQYLQQLQQLDHAQKQAMEDHVRQAFDRMRANVDPYLDYYYSLKAEYIRVLGLVSSSAEAKAQEDFRRIIGRGVQFDLAKIGDIPVEQSRILKESYDLALGRLLDSRRLSSGFLGNRIITRSMSTSESILAPGIVMVTSLSQRAAGVASIAGATFLVTKVVGKTAAKGVFKLAGKALLKLGASKVVTIGGTTAAGAGLGSLVPGLGTLAGAAVGAIIGVFTDAAILTAEEWYARSDYRREILTSINAAEAEMMNNLLANRL